LGLEILTVQNVKVTIFWDMVSG